MQLRECVFAFVFACGALQCEGRRNSTTPGDADIDGAWPPRDFLYFGGFDAEILSVAVGGSDVYFTAGTRLFRASKNGSDTEPTALYDCPSCQVGQLAADDGAA